jgi:hypothetical protein
MAVSWRGQILFYWSTTQKVLEAERKKKKA